MSRNKILFILIFCFIAASCSNNPAGPCDIYERGGTPCVAAHSTTRVLYSKYKGPLYQIQRESDGATLDIGSIRGGYADAAAQDAFCKGTTAYITVIYDQSGHGNHLYQATPGTFFGPASGNFNTLPIADMAPASLNGHKVYGVYIMPGMGFRNNGASGLAVDDEPEGIYYVIDGTHYDNGCCFDYGNASTNGKAVGRGTMETAYYGNATAWGSGNGDGPWIMSDMEAGLFSGYNPKQNDVPAIDSWNFVSVYVNGGGGNKWDLRGADATKKEITTFYSGVRPLSKENDYYYPMHKKGAVLLGNGGDNGNGSAGTFYEGVMTSGYPSEATIKAVQANIAEHHYAVQTLALSRLTSFTSGTPQTVNVVFTNNTGKVLKGLNVALDLPEGWKAEESSSYHADKAVAPGEKASAAFKVTASGISTGFLTAEVTWKNGSESAREAVRCVSRIKVNEIGLTGGQFIELYNPAEEEIDVSGYRIEVTRSGWAPVTAAVLPDGTSMKPGGFLLLRPSDESIKASSRAATSIFIPVSTSQRLKFTSGTSCIPVTSAEGFEEGDIIGIGSGKNYEEIQIAKAGTPATQTVLSEAVKSGDTEIDLEVTEFLAGGSELTIGTGSQVEKVKVKKVLKVSKAPVRMPGMRPEIKENGRVLLESGLRLNHDKGVDAWCQGSGLALASALEFDHFSGEAVEDLGKGISSGYQKQETSGAPLYSLCKDGIHFGYTMSLVGGAVALYSGDTLIDAVVYGSQQSNSSGFGTITRPDIAVLEGDQANGGCIAVVPQTLWIGSRFSRGLDKREPPKTSLIRFPDGKDDDQLCRDFLSSGMPTPGAKNISQQ